MLPEQSFGDLAIGSSLQPAVKCADAEYEPLSTSNIQRKQRRSKSPPFERAPKPVCCLRTNVKMIVKRQLDGKWRGACRQFL